MANKTNTKQENAPKAEPTIKSTNEIILEALKGASDHKELGAWISTHIGEISEEAAELFFDYIKLKETE